MKKQGNLSEMHIIKDTFPIVMIYNHSECEKGKVHIIPFVHADLPRIVVEFNWRCFMLLKNPKDSISTTEVKMWIKNHIEIIKNNIVKNKIEEEGKNVEKNENDNLPKEIIILPKEMRQ